MDQHSYRYRGVEYRRDICDTSHADGSDIGFLQLCRMVCSSRSEASPNKKKPCEKCEKACEVVNLMQPIYTIGHSTRPIEKFIELLKSQQIGQLVDIRSIPRSRHNPQYEQDALEKSLPKAGIKYVYLKELGGLRPVAKDSANDAWHNKSFQGYADYMQTEDFEQALQKLLDVSAQKPTAIMCAEAVPWRCHRSLVGDALVVRSVPVYDIISESSVQKHSITPFAVVNGIKITYPKKDVKR